MSRRIVSMTTQTPGVYGDTTTLTTYPFGLASGSALQVNRIWEVSISGQASSTSSPTFMLLARDSPVGIGTPGQATGGTDAVIDAACAGSAGGPFGAWTGSSFGTTNPSRSTAYHLLNASLNAFGGVYFWRANRAEECITVIGVGAPLGEVSLSAFTGSTAGAIGAHMIYETL